MRTFWRSAAQSTEHPVLYVHGVPTHSIEWPLFLRVTGGVAVDLPGFGRSEKPRHFDYSIAGYDNFLELFVDHLGWDKFSLVVHDWGAAALPFAARMRDRLERLVVIDGVPLLPGYRWHWVARLWRTPVVGELTMGFMTKTSMIRRASAGGTDQTWPRDFADEVWERFDQGTRRAILKLHRSGAPDQLGRMAGEVARISAPVLVLWGTDDPFIGPEWARRYADILPNAQCEVIEGAGHWPWQDRPEAIDRVTGFLTQGLVSAATAKA